MHTLAAQQNTPEYNLDVTVQPTLVEHTRIFVPVSVGNGPVASALAVYPLAVVTVHKT